MAQRSTEAQRAVMANLGKLSELVASEDRLTERATTTIIKLCSILPQAVPLWDSGMEPSAFLAELYYQAALQPFSISGPTIQQHLASLQSIVSELVPIQATARGTAAYIVEHARKSRVNVSKFLQNGKLTPYFRERLLPDTIDTEPMGLVFDPRITRQLVVRRFMVPVYQAAFPEETSSVPGDFQELMERIGDLIVTVDQETIIMRYLEKEIQQELTWAYKKLIESRKPRVLVAYPIAGGKTRHLFIRPKMIILAAIKRWGLADA